MMYLILRWFINAFALWIVTKIIEGIRIENFGTALLAVIIIGLVNALIRPLLVILTLPINVLTLGLFTFVINALMLMLAAAVTPGFVVDGFASALVGSILLSIVSTLLHYVLI